MLTHGCITNSVSRIITDYEAYLFGEGHWLQAWEKMGARPAVIDGRAGTPLSCGRRTPRSLRGGRLQSVGLAARHAMISLGAERTLGNVRARRAAGAHLQVRNRDGAGPPVTKRDPYALALRAAAADGVRHRDLGAHAWQDAAWMADRQERGTALDAPMADLRSARRIVAAQPARGFPVADLARAGGGAGAVRHARWASRTSS